MWKNSFTIKRKRNKIIKEDAKNNTRKGTDMLIIRFPVIMLNEKLTKPTATVVQKVAINSLNKSIKVECRIIPAYVRKTNINTTLTNTITNTMMLP